MAGRRRGTAADAAVSAALGARLRELRTLRGLTREALAERLGISHQQLQKYETGANRVAVPILLRFADALETTPAALLDGLGPAGSAAATAPADTREAVALMAAVRQLAAPVRAALRALAEELPPAAAQVPPAPLAAVPPAPDPVPGDPGPDERRPAALPPARRRRRRGAVWDPADIRPRPRG